MAASLKSRASVTSQAERKRNQPVCIKAVKCKKETFYLTIFHCFCLGEVYRKYIRRFIVRNISHCCAGCN